jgi:tetratricopeptide (TPR) repeat protein
LDVERPYPWKASDLNHVVALVAASPAALSKRMSLVQTRLAGSRSMVVAVRPTSVADALRHSQQVESVQLWELPFLTLQEQQARTKEARQQARDDFEVFAWQPLLWKARVLHFQGQFAGQDSAKTFYRQSRPPDSQIAKLEEKNAKLARLVRQAKASASFWLGLLTFDQQDYQVAIDYLGKRTLEAASAELWAGGARYNLARAYEATGQIDKAIELYQGGDSPQNHGNQLRARWLNSRSTAPDRAAVSPLVEEIPARYTSALRSRRPGDPSAPWGDPM